MKKITTLLLAAGLVVSSFTPSAEAFEIKPFGQYIIQLEGVSGSKGTYDIINSTPSGIGSVENFMASQQFRFGFDAIMGEDVSGTVLFQLGDTQFGQTAGGTTGLGGKDNNFGARLAYIDWTVPTTSTQFRMGLQTFILPSSAFGSAVLDDRSGGITLNIPINDAVAVSAMWFRPAADVETDKSSADVASLIIDVNMDGWRLTPWAAFALNSDNAEVGFAPNNTTTGYGGSAIWGGASFELSMFDPFNIAIDAYYKQTSFGDGYTAPAGTEDSVGSYLVAASFSYMTAFGTPAIKGWYTSGNDAKTNGFGAPIAISAAFAATTIMFDDSVLDNGMSNIRGGDPAGTLGIVGQWADITFIENLTHLVRVAYIAGTNENFNKVNNTRDFAYLTKDDSVIEINLNTQYMIYKNLAMNLELGYLIPDLEDDSPALPNVQAEEINKDIFRAALNFVYEF